MQRPEEQRGQARIFLESVRLGVAEDLAQGFLGKRLEDVGEETALVRFDGVGVAAERHFAVGRREHLVELAVAFERGTEAGEDGVRAANAVLDQRGQPFPNPLLHRRLHRAPIADARVGGARAADKVDASGQSGRVTRHHPRRHLSRDGPRSRDDKARLQHAGKQRFPSLCRLVRENNAANSVLTKNTPSFAHRVGHLLLVIVWRLDGFALRVRSINNALSLFVGKLVREPIFFWIRQRTFKPNVKEVGQVRIRNTVVVGRVCHPHRATHVGKRQVASVGAFNERRRC